MNRQLRMGGGIMSIQPRQQYGLGSIVKSVGKAVKGAVKGAVDTVKDVAKSDIGKAALIGAAAFGIPGAPGALGGGLFGRASMFGPATGLFGFQGIGPTLGAAKAGLFGAAPVGRDAFMGMAGKTRAAGGLSKLAKTGLAFAGGSLLPAVLGEAQETGEAETITRNIPALRNKLTNAYKLQRTFSDAPDEDAAIQAQVETDLSEYTSGAGGYADGGRIGYALGTNNPEQNAVNAAGIMGLPLNTNPAGATELDLRETGGFIPPVGVKERADDIPAMLSNNEFVFTADAVRGMGGGDVDKGAQRLYDQMKMLEKGGRV
jgi:hypothetical protein